MYTIDEEKNMSVQNCVDLRQPFAYNRDEVSMAFNREKFKALIHYVCWKCEDPTKLGAVKLNKVLWFSELLTYLHFNSPIAGARYVKLQFGPAPVAILPLLEELKNEGALAIRDVEYFGRAKREFFALTEPNISLFLAQEISVVDSVAQKICGEHTAASISDLTHNEIWEMAQIGEDLPFYTVFSARRGEVGEDDLAWADEKIGACRAAA